MSRTHAVLKYVNGDFYIEDQNSRFGTLVEIKSPLQLYPQVACCVQVGRTVMTLLVKSQKKQKHFLAHQTVKVSDKPEFAVEIHRATTGVTDYTTTQEPGSS